MASTFDLIRARVAAQGFTTKKEVAKMLVANSSKYDETDIPHLVKTQAYQRARHAAEREKKALRSVDGKLYFVDPGEIPAQSDPTEKLAEIFGN